MGYDNDQDDIVLGELDDVTGPTEVEAEAAATEYLDDSQLTPEDSMRRRSAARREERERKKARRRELARSSPDTGRGKRIAAVTVAVLLCVTLVAGGVYYFYFRGQNAGTQVAGNAVTAGMDLGNITVITASGTTSIGMSMETFDLNLSDVELTIDEVYVSGRDEVEAGQPILKINEDTITSARTSLQQTAQSAEYAYQLGVIDAQKNVITAKDTYQQALIALEYAEQDYADTVSEAQAEIDSLQRQVDEQQELVDEYQSAVNDSEYYSNKYKVPERKAQLEKDQQLLEDIYNDDSTRVAEHLDYLYGGSYEAYLNGTSMIDEQSGAGTGGAFGGGFSMPSGGGDYTPPSGSGESGSGSGTTGGDTTGGSTAGGDTTGGDTTGGSTGSETTGSDTTTGDTTGTDTTGTTDTNADGTATESITDTTQEVVDNTITYARNKIAVWMLSASDEETTSETVTNKVYYAEMPSGAISGSMPAASGTGNASAGTASSGSSSGNSSSGSATITDEYSGSSSSSSSTTRTVNFSTNSLSTSDLTYFPWYSAYVALAEEVSEEKEEYESAVTKAERDQSRASALLSQAQNRLESLQLKLRTAQNNLITTTEEAQETLNTVKATATAAQETYNTSIRSIENSTDTLKDAMEEAEENLEAFEEQIGDGYLYTSNAGTIMMVGVSKGDTLTYNSMIAAYTDPGSISVTAAVDQSNIASISVGDTVAVVFSEAGVYQGYVAAINPVTQSSSRTSVSYSVTVELEGDVSAVEENISATVYFGDAVPLIFEQAGDQMHSPDTTTSEGQ